jgi:hypothetical protein
VSLVNTIRQERGLAAIYLATFFFDSPTSTASTIRSWSLYSLSMRSTSDCSPRHRGHQVVQNCTRTTLPLTDSLVNVSPLRVFATNRGAVLGPELPPKAQIDVNATPLHSAHVTSFFRLCIMPPRATRPASGHKGHGVADPSFSLHVANRQNCPAPSARGSKITHL